MARGPRLHSRFSVVDFIVFLASVVMLLSFFFATWFRVPGTDRTLAGIQLLAPVSMLNLMLLIPIAAIIGMGMSSWGISDQRAMRFALPGVTGAGIVGLVYFATFYLQRTAVIYHVFGTEVNQAALADYGVLQDATGAFLAAFRIDIVASLGPGFWLALVICLLLLLQIFAKRPQVAPQLSGTGELGRARPTTRIERFLDLAYTFPWWAAVMVVIGVYVSVNIADDPIYDNIYTQLRAGVSLTLRVTFSAYAGGLLIGLIIGVIRSYPPRPNAAVIALAGSSGPDRPSSAMGLPLALLRSLFSLVHLLIYNAATFFVEVMRGLPILIVLLVSAFIIVPDVRNTLNDAFGWNLEIRGSSVTTAIVALALAYGAYISEIFRAGVQSIERGQIEAARSLGMNSRQTLRFVILPQAFRRVLPPLGNDFIAMVKDSSLVTILGLRDVTQIAKVSSGSSFRYLETYLTVAVIYLMMTILGSLCIRVLEQYLRQQER